MAKFLLVVSNVLIVLVMNCRNLCAGNTFVRRGVGNWVYSPYCDGDRRWPRGQKVQEVDQSHCVG